MEEHIEETEVIHLEKEDEGEMEKSQYEYLVEGQNEIKAFVLSLKELFHGKISIDKSQREAFDKLYDEMKLYKENFVFSAMRPIIMDLVLLYDNIKRMEKYTEDTNVLKATSHIKEELLEILYRQDVEPIITTETKIDRKLQKVIKSVSTCSEFENGDIIEVVREGFLRDGKTLRLQEVICKKYQGNKE